jgi:DNA-binding GntR family transcriptional regulator
MIDPAAGRVGGRLHGQVDTRRMQVLQPTLRAPARTFLWRDAAAVVRRAIVGGEFAAGDRVSEAQLAEQLGVSRAPVRDAVRVLIQEGLLEQHNGVTTVVGWSEADVQQLYDVRITLERHAVQLAAGRVDLRAAAEWRAALSRLQQAADAGDMAAYSAADLAFHRALVRAARNRWLLVVWETLAPTLGAALSVAEDLLYRRRPASVSAAGHQAILEQVLSGPAEAAERLLQQHTRETVPLLIEALRRGTHANGAPAGRRVGIRRPQPTRTAAAAGGAAT